MRNKVSQMRDDGVESNDFNFLVLSEGNDFIKPVTGPAPGFWLGLGPLLLGNYCESERQQLAGIGCHKKGGRRMRRMSRNQGRYFYRSFTENNTTLWVLFRVLSSGKVFTDIKFPNNFGCCVDSRWHGM